MNSIFKLFLLFTFVVIFLFSCDKNESDPKKKTQEENLEKIIDQFVSKLKKAEKKTNLSYYKASIKGTEDNWEEYSNNKKKLNELLSDKDVFQKLKKIKKSGNISNDTLRRSLVILYNEMLANQIDTNKLNKLTDLEAQIESKYSEFRAIVGNKKYSDNEIEAVMDSSTDSDLLEKVWKAHKEIGSFVESDILEIVKVRNEIAKELGFDNFHSMKLKLNEQEPEEIEKLFDELDRLTKDSFSSLKDEIDQNLADIYGIKKSDLMPWHYQNRFFQEAPQIYEVDLDKYYEDQDVVKLSEKYYKAIDMPVDGILEKSDLYSKEGKNQHAYCTNIDRDEEDIRILCNVEPNSRWMETMLHELGHAAYEKYYDEGLPWLLKEPANTFTTEAVAMLFGRLASNPEWIKKMTDIPDDERSLISPVCSKILTMQQLVFSRWTQVMYRFERNMYEDPDQDLNKLWWDLAEKYQMLRKPEGRDNPDWASKIHVALFPCYYHNYLMGEILASQLHEHIVNEIYNGDIDQFYSYHGKKEVGDYLKKNVFAPGVLYHWNEMIKKATGKKLNAKAYSKQFINQ